MRTITRKTNVRRHDRHLPSKVADVRKHQRTVTRQMIGTIPVKDLTYPQAKKRFPFINPNADYDGDKVINKKDCRPFDEERQDDDEWERNREEIKQRVAARREAERMKQEEEKVIDFQFEPSNFDKMDYFEFERDKPNFRTPPTPPKGKLFENLFKKR